MNRARMSSSHRTWPAPASVLLAALPLACGGEGIPGDSARDTGFVVRDSAGIEVVENDSPQWSEGTGWTIDPQPALQIGAVEGEEAYLFQSVWDAARAPDGRILIAEGRGTYGIRLFDPDGRHLRTIGRPGDGPGEFGGPAYLAVAPPDTIVVWDPGHYRISRFSLDGELLGETRIAAKIDSLDIPRFVNGLVWELGSDGSLLSTHSGPDERSEGLNESTRRLILIRDAGILTRDFGLFPAGQLYMTRRADGVGIGIGNPWAPVTYAALRNDPPVVAVGGEGAWEVTHLAPEGSIRRILRAAIPRTPITDAALQTARDGFPEGARRMGISVGQYEDAFSHLPIPDSIPAIGGLEWDLEGNLWVGRRPVERGYPTRYDIFGPEGRWLGTLEMPAGIDRIHEIGADYLLAGWTDELGVRYLRMYTIRKPGG